MYALLFVSLLEFVSLFVVTTDYICHIIHATVTNFDIIIIKDLVIFIISTKMFIQ